MLKFNMDPMVAIDNGKMSGSMILTSDTDVMENSSCRSSTILSQGQTSDAGTSLVNLMKENEKWAEGIESSSGDVNISESELKATLKRKRSTLTLQKKLEIIERIKKGEKVTKLALEYGLGKATVSDIKRQEEKIVNFISKSTCSLTVEKRKSMRKPQDVHVEKALHIWLNRERKKGSIVTGPALMEKAKSFHRQIYGNENTSFKFSSGWLHRFKLRNGIKQPRVKGNAKKKNLNDNDSSQVQVYLDQMRRIIVENILRPEQIYTVSINKFHWGALPTKLSQISKNSITILTCVNARGNHKLRPCVVGRKEINKIIGQANADKLPFRYYHQENGWLDVDMFQNWFQEEFVTQMNLYHPKSLLLLENSMLHLEQSPFTSDDGRVLCFSVPSEVAFTVHPINAYLFDTVKLKYRMQLVEKALRCHSSKRKCVAKSSKSKSLMTLKDAGYILSDVWDSITAESVNRYWMETLYCLEATDEHGRVLDELYMMGIPQQKEDDKEKVMECLKTFNVEISESDVSDWIALDGENINSDFTDKDIIEFVRCELSESDSDDESQTECLIQSIPTNTEAAACFKKCLQWLECQKDCDPSQLQMLWKWQNITEKMS